MKIQKINWGVGLGGQGGYERIIEVFGKIRGAGVRFRGGGGSGWGGQGGCEPRIEVFVKLQKKLGGSGEGVGGRGRVGGSGWM